MREQRETMHCSTTGSMFDLCTQHSSSALLQGMHIARPTLLTLSISGRNAMQREREYKTAPPLHCHYHNLQGKINSASEIKPPPAVQIACQDFLPSDDQMQFHSSQQFVLPVNRIKIWLSHMLLLIRHLTTSLTCGA